MATGLKGRRGRRGRGESVLRLPESSAGLLGLASGSPRDSGKERKRFLGKRLAAGFQGLSNAALVDMSGRSGVA